MHQMYSRKTMYGTILTMYRYRCMYRYVDQIVYQIKEISENNENKLSIKIIICIKHVVFHFYLVEMGNTFSELYRYMGPLTTFKQGSYADVMMGKHEVI